MKKTYKFKILEIKNKLDDLIKEKRSILYYMNKIDISEFSDIDLYIFSNDLDILNSRIKTYKDILKILEEWIWEEYNLE